MTAAPLISETELSLPTRVACLMRQKLGSERMDLWFGADAKWTLFDNNTIGIEVSSAFVADCVTRMFRVQIQQSIQEIAGSNFGYRVAVIQNGLLAAQKDTVDCDDRDSCVEPAETVSAAALTQSDKTTNLEGSSKPSLRLHRVDGSSRVASTSAVVGQEAAETSALDRLAELRRENERRWSEFIPGEHNRLVHTAATMVLERPGQISPLFIFGPHGSGKTHLAVGLANQLRTTRQLRRVVVLSGEQFTIEFTESARGGGFASFRRKYRDVEVLVLDDLQFCLGKSATMAELRNTIDMLLREKRQVILVADRSLNELTGLTADLHARLAGGMACGMEPLDVETRTKLMERLVSKHQLSIETEAIKHLAAQASGDARVLHGMVHRLIVQQRLHDSTLTTDQAVRCTHDLLRASQSIVRIKDIDRVVSDVFGLDEELLRSKTKCQAASQPRMLAMFLARKYTRSALADIGEYFGNRQHSTVISAQKKVDGWIEQDEMIPCGRGKLSVREILKTLESSLRVS
jgi:chromosomal replication initiator protein